MHREDKKEVRVVIKNNRATASFSRFNYDFGCPTEIYRRNGELILRYRNDDATFLRDLIFFATEINLMNNDWSDERGLYYHHESETYTIKLPKNLEIKILRDK